MAGIWNSKRIINASVVENRTIARLPGACYAQRATKNSRGIVSALNINTLTKIETTPDIGDCNELTNAHNAESRLPKVNIIVAAPLAEKSNVSGKKSAAKRKRPPRTAILKRSMVNSLLLL